MMNLTANIDRIAVKLDTQWTWLDANPDHPEHGAREDRWIRILRRYERLCDERDGVLA